MSTTHREKLAAAVPAAIAGHDSCVFLRLGQEVFRGTEKQLSTLGLRTRHFTVLAVLDASGGASQMELSVQTRIDTTTMVAAIDHLEDCELVTKRRDQSDRRRTLISITDHGRAELSRANSLIAEVDNNMFADLTTTERRQLSRILTKLNTSQAFTDVTASPKQQGTSPAAPASVE